MSRKFKYLQRTYKEVSKLISLKLYNINSVSETLNSVKVSEHYIVDNIKIDILCNIDANVSEIKAYRNVFVPSIISTIEKLPTYVKKALANKCSIFVCDSNILHAEHEFDDVTGDYCPYKKQIRVGYRGLKTISTLLHEIGHFIDNILCFKNYSNNGCFLSQEDIFVQNAYKQEAHLFRKYAQTDITEFVASVFEYYFLYNELPKGCKESGYIIYSYMKSLENMYYQNSFNEIYGDTHVS